MRRDSISTFLIHRHTYMHTETNHLNQGCTWLEPEEPPLCLSLSPYTYTHSPEGYVEHGLHTDLSPYYDSHSHSITHLHKHTQTGLPPAPLHMNTHTHKQRERERVMKMRYRISRGARSNTQKLFILLFFFFLFSFALGASAAYNPHRHIKLYIYIQSLIVRVTITQGRPIRRGTMALRASVILSLFVASVLGVDQDCKKRAQDSYQR
jgi:hypothetical protein